jgi:hypothetical protein
MASALNGGSLSRSPGNYNQWVKYMIRKDFEDGGFPINNRAPVVCITGEGLVFISYNSFNLKKVMDQKGSEIKKLLGIWPGKNNTDFFILNPEKYGKIAPPEEHADIDNAVTILIEYGGDNTFSSVLYSFSTGPAIMSRDPALEKFLKEAGKKYTVRYV